MIFITKIIKFFAIRMKTKYDYNICVHIYACGTALNNSYTQYADSRRIIMQK